MKLSAIFAITGLVAGVAIAAPAMAATNLLANGGFEATGFGGTSSYYNIGTQTGINGGDHPVPSDFGWTVSQGNVDIVANGAYGPNLSDGGAYNLDLVGYGSTGEISQSINTVLNRVYNVSFKYSSNNGIDGPIAAVSGSTLVGTVTGSHAWQTFNGSFLGTGAPVTFSINETYGANNGGVFLDNVSVSAIPEPASWAMMILGMGAMGAVLRRRRESGAVAA